MTEQHPLDDPAALDAFRDEHPDLVAFNAELARQSAERRAARKGE